MCIDVHSNSGDHAAFSFARSNLEWKTQPARSTHDRIRSISTLIDQERSTIRFCDNLLAWHHGWWWAWAQSASFFVQHHTFKLQLAMTATTFSSSSLVSLSINSVASSCFILLTSGLATLCKSSSHRIRGTRVPPAGSSRPTSMLDRSVDSFGNKAFGLWFDLAGATEFFLSLLSGYNCRICS